MTERQRQYVQFDKPISEMTDEEIEEIGKQLFRSINAQSSKAAQPVRTKARATSDVREWIQTIVAFMARQGNVLTSSLSANPAIALEQLFDQERWDRELATDLLHRAVQTTRKAGREALESVGIAPDMFDTDRTVSWLMEHVQGVARGVNSLTQDQLAAALALRDEQQEDPAPKVRKMIDGNLEYRPERIAETQVTQLSGFGTEEAAQQSGAEMHKTWVTTNAESRATHAAMHGETVPIGQTFSNGGRWPGDGRLPPGQRINCDCHMTLTPE